MTQLQVPEVPSVQPAEVQPDMAERMHPVTRRIVAGVLAGGIALAGIVTAAKSEAVQNFIDDPVDALFDPLFDHEEAF
jgi:hypothetical protein